MGKKITEREQDMLENYMKQQVGLTKWLIGIIFSFLILILSGMGTMYKSNSVDHAILLDNANWTHTINDYVIQPTKTRSIINSKAIVRIDSTLSEYGFIIYELQK